MSLILKEFNAFINNKEVLISGDLLVGLGGLEPPTSPLSGVRSNQAELQTQLNWKEHFTLQMQSQQYV